MGRMIQIDDFIKELQETRRKFGNTCVYIRDVSWGAVALNREAEDEANKGKCEYCVNGIVNTGVSGFTLTCKMCNGTGEGPAVKSSG